MGAKVFVGMFVPLCLPTQVMLKTRCSGQMLKGFGVSVISGTLPLETCFTLETLRGLVTILGVTIIAFVSVTILLRL